MSFFKGTLLSACLLAGALASGLTGSAQAQNMARLSSQGGAPIGLAGPEQRVALVIGNSNYRNVVRLPNPVNDAEAIAKVLNTAGFEVVSATDLNHNEMIQVVQDFSVKIANRGPNAVAMVYYAGHGVQLAGENYLVPVDAKISSEPDLVNGSVRLVDLMATLEAIPSRMRIVILDACRNNPFPSLNDAGRGLAIVDAPNGSIVGYSTAPGTQALDGTGNHSPYAAAFLRLAHEKNLPIEQLFKRIRLDVNNSTNGQQTPWESSSLTSDFYFFGDTAVAATRAPAQVKTAYVASDLPSRASRQAYDYVLAENSIDSYQEFIRYYPHDPLSDRIRVLLASLVQAKEWHHAVVTNSPVAYKSFYEKHSNSPYAPGALKLAEQPKAIPLLQPTQILAPSSIKLGGLGKYNHGPHLGAKGVLQGHAGSQGNVLQGGLGGGAAGKLGNGGRIVTLPSHTANASSGKIGGVGSGKITTFPGGGLNNKVTTLPAGGLNKMGAQQNGKLNGGASRIADRPAKSFAQMRANQQSTGMSRFNTGARPQFRQQSFANSGGSNFRFASQSQGRFGGGGGGFGGGGFGRR
jgi:hypothetical protein